MNFDPNDPMFKNRENLRALLEIYGVKDVGLKALLQQEKMRLSDRQILQRSYCAFCRQVPSLVEIRDEPYNDSTVICWFCHGERYELPMSKLELLGNNLDSKRFILGIEKLNDFLDRGGEPGFEMKF